MAPRLELQTALEGILGSDDVHFQPPTNVQMKYPAIVYNLDFMLPEHANNKPYKVSKRYLVTVITKDPDSSIPDLVMELPECTFDRFYTSANLNHYVYKLFF